MLSGGQDAHEELLPVAEAAVAYGMTKAKVRKMVSLYELEGARKVRGVYGLVWRIPTAAFEARALMRQTPAPASSDATVTVDLPSYAERSTDSSAPCAD